MILFSNLAKHLSPRYLHNALHRSTKQGAVVRPTRRLMILRRGYSGSLMCLTTGSSVLLAAIQRAHLVGPRLGTRMHPCQKIPGSDSEHRLELVLWVVSLQTVYHMTRMLVVYDV